jgi:SHS2 domain-containing protein
MSYRFLEDIALADVAFEVEAADLPALFTDAAEALLKVQIDNPEAVCHVEKVALEFAHSQIDLLLYRFLQELIFYKDAKRWLLRADRVRLETSGDLHRLKAQISGEILDPARHHQRVDVKAVTFHRLSVAQTPAGWKATIVLDI